MTGIYFADTNGKSQFLLDCLGRCLKLMFVSTDKTSSYEFASQFGLAIFMREKTQNVGDPCRPRVSLFE